MFWRKRVVIVLCVLFQIAIHSLWLRCFFCLPLIIECFQVNYHQVEIIDPTTMSILANNEFRTICTQTDPVSTSDEDDFLLEDEEDLYEELDFPAWVFTIIKRLQFISSWIKIVKMKCVNTFSTPKLSKQKYP